MKYKRWLIICLICAAVLITLLSLLMIGVAALIRQKMMHEGMTQSQWYESTVRSYRFCSLSAGGTVLARYLTVLFWTYPVYRCVCVQKLKKCRK